MYMYDEITNFRDQNQMPKHIWSLEHGWPHLNLLG